MRIQSLLSLGQVLALLAGLTLTWTPSLHAEEDPFAEDTFVECDGFGDDFGGEDPFFDEGDDGDFGLDDSAEDDVFGELDEVKPKRIAKRSRTARKKVERVARHPGKKAGRAEKLSHQQRLQRLGIYSVDPLEIKELRILEALRNEVSIAFDGETLADAIDYLGADVQIPIVFDNTALNEESIEPTSETVSLPPVDNISLDAALKLMLADLGLTFLVKNEVMVITTQTAAEEYLVTRVYRRNPDWKMTEKQLTNAIQTAVLPNSWESIGGPGAIAIVHDGLVINNSMKAHDEINELFAKLERLYAPTNSGSGSSEAK